MKKTRVVLSPEAEEVYSRLNKEATESKTEEKLLRGINKKIDLIKNNPHYGEPISKKKIPKEYVEKYGVTNLFWVELPNFWRMIYTLTNGETIIEIIAFVIDIVDHPTYNKKFGYKKK